MRVWIDQDLCTGDGLCTDHCPEVFMLLEDGLSYVRDDAGVPCNDPGGRASIVAVPGRLGESVIAAALDCPGECIFVEDDDTEPTGDRTDHHAGDGEVIEADVVVDRMSGTPGASRP